MAEAYIGKYISLISKKHIRYGGMLVAIDSAAGTITLQNGGGGGGC